MTERGEETKRRLIETTIDLVKIKGYNGVGLQEIIRESGTPKGSLYFHFPNGKEELVATALQFNGKEIDSLLRQIFQCTASLKTAMRTVIDFFINELESSGFKKGCPLAASSSDASSFSERIQMVCKENFRSWELTISQRFEKAGIDSKKAMSLATLFISSVEGAVILSQAYKDSAPLKSIAECILGMLPEESNT